MSHDFSNRSFRRSYINLVRRLLKPAVNGGAAGELAEARSLERRGYDLAAVVGGEIHQSMIFPAVDLAVGLLTLHIV